MMFGTGSNAELTLKYERVKGQNGIRTSKHINKQTSPISIVLPLRVSRSLRSLIIFFFNLYFFFLHRRSATRYIFKAGTDKTVYYDAKKNSLLVHITNSYKFGLTVTNRTN